MVSVNNIDIVITDFVFITAITINDRIFIISHFYYNGYYNHDEKLL